MATFISICIPVALAILIIIFAISRYKVARVDQALIITGGKDPKIIRSGGGIVWPIIRKHGFFDLCIKTIVAEGDVIKTKTGVPVVINWTAQIRPNADNPDELRVAATSFLERSADSVSRDIKYTLDGGVREVVSDMTPEAVLREKEEFSKRVKESVVDEMHNLGFLLVSLNIQEVTDEGGYYDNLAATDRENRRREAANITAENSQAIREKKATAERTAKEAELDSEQAIRERAATADEQAKKAELAAELAIAENTRTTEVKKSGFEAEQAKARADAEIAGELRTTERRAELAEKEGQIEVQRQTIANEAAIKEQEVIATKAETDKRRLIIEADAGVEQAKRQKDKQTLEAEAKAAVQAKEAEGAANARKIEADGAAEAMRREADGKATAAQREAEGTSEAIKLQAIAEAERIQKTGAAEAAATQAKGLAEAKAIEAKGLAEAEAEKKLAEARAGNDKVNFEIAKLEIERDTRVSIATSVAQVVANIGEKATFVDLGGNRGDGTGNVLTNVLGQIPELMKKLNVENMALNGEPITDTIKGLVSSVVEPLGVLNKETKVISESSIQVEPEQE